ncbi:MAG: ABC transporter substrate-binding protein [Deltaproteobacteria bacterium]|nr:ABC transporter substrate-binding protein [Deltaproteobacteria bacterium]
MRTTIFRSRMLFVSLFIFGVLDAWDAGAQTQKLRLAYVSPSGALAVPWIAKEAGLFEKNGVGVELIFIRGASTMIQTLVSGDIDLAHVAANPAVEANLGGADVVVLATALNRPVGFYMMGQPGVKNVEGLRGGRVGITRFGSATDLLSRVALRQFKLQPDRDVAIIQLGGIPEIAAGLKTKVVSAGFVSSPLNLDLMELGFNVLVDFGRDLLFPHAPLIARRTTMKQRDQALRGIMRAFAEGIKIYRTQRDFSIKVLEKYTRTSDYKKLAQTYDTYAPFLERIPYVDLKGIENILLEIAPRQPSAKIRKPAEFVAHRYVKELEDSGFFRTLYGERP